MDRHAHRVKLLLVANTDWYLYNFRLPLATYLERQGFEVVMVSPHGRHAASLREAGFRWLEWPVRRRALNPWRELVALLRLARLYRREKPDLVHHYTIKPVIYGSLAARLAGIPAIVNSVSGRGYVFLGRSAKARLLRAVVKPLYRLALGGPGGAVTFENDADRQAFIRERLVFRDRAFLLEGAGIDAEAIIPTPEPDTTPLIVLPGRMLWDKGVGTLVEAARILRASQASFRVALVGPPDPGNPSSIDASTLRGWEAEGLVEVWGWRDDIHAVYRQAHIVTLPSRGEGMPTVLLEAAALGRPIVTTDAPGCRDAVIDRETGLIVPVDDAPALAAALKELLADASLRSRMGAAGRDLVLRRFSSHKMNAAMLKIYGSVRP